MKINSRAALEAALASTVRTSPFVDILRTAEALYGSLDDNNFYLVRDFLRLNWTGANGVLLDEGNAWTPVDGGRKDHFLHVSTDNADKVAYTKDEDRGRDDVQTRTTASLYFDKYGRAARNEDVFTVPKDKAPEAAQGATQAPVDVPNTKTLAETLGLLMALEVGQQDSGRDDDIVSAVNKALSILLIVVKK